MTSYTATNSNSGEIIGRGLTLKEAAEARLTYDGATYALVVEDGESRIEGPEGIGGRGRTITYCDGPAPHGRCLVEWRGATDQQEQRLYERVITAGWKDCPVRIMTDDDYDRMMARMMEEDRE